MRKSCSVDRNPSISVGVMVVTNGNRTTGESWGGFFKNSFPHGIFTVLLPPTFPQEENIQIVNSFEYWPILQATIRISNVIYMKHSEDGLPKCELR